jgi:3-phosphoshikimate 1-carboxyvinyltransferase
VTEYLALPPAAMLRGRVRVPSSKSATNRALVAAALTSSPVEILDPLESDDTAALARCLSSMGASIAPTRTGVRVAGPLEGYSAREIVLDAADSGTAARFLAAVASVVPGRFLLTGSARLRERPMQELVDALRRAGARISSRGAEGFLPLSIEGRPFQSSEIAVDGSRSSQFVSAILLAGLAVEGGLTVRVTGTPVSAPYVAMTLETLRELGHETRSGATLSVRRGARVAARYQVPGDYSSAIPLAAAVGAASGRVTLAGLRADSGDADAAALPVLERMGVSFLAGDDGLEALAERRAPANVDVAAGRFPDAVPALAALAAFAEGASRFSGIAHLRLKESDRIAALAELLRAAGAETREEADALTVVGPARGNEARVLPTFRDHRMAMAAAILALRLPGILIEDPDCVAKSYPRFFRDLEELGVRPRDEIAPSRQ